MICKPCDIPARRDLTDRLRTTPAKIARLREKHPANADFSIGAGLSKR
jgi:hypothetical protein